MPGRPKFEKCAAQLWHRAEVERPRLFPATDVINQALSRVALVRRAARLNVPPIYLRLAYDLDDLSGLRPLDVDSAEGFMRFHDFEDGGAEHGRFETSLNCQRQQGL